MLIKNHYAALGAKYNTLSSMKAGILGYWRQGNSPKFKDGHTRESVMRELMKIDGVDEKKAKELTQPDVVDHVGYAPFELTNNNANIRRYKQNAERQKRFEKQAEAVRESTGGEAVKSVDFQGGKVHLDYDDNRMRIAHDSKPSADVIAKLKSRGFRWSPSNKAWQRQLTTDAKYAAADITGIDHKLFNVKSPEVERNSSRLDPAIVIAPARFRPVLLAN